MRRAAVLQRNQSVGTSECVYSPPKTRADFIPQIATFKKEVIEKMPQLLSIRGRKISEFYPTRLQDRDLSRSHGPSGELRGREAGSATGEMLWPISMFFPPED